jgi:hypothetical protein
MYSPIGRSQFGMEIPDTALLSPSGNRTAQVENNIPKGMLLTVYTLRVPFPYLHIKTGHSRLEIDSKPLAAVVNKEQFPNALVPVFFIDQPGQYGERKPLKPDSAILSHLIISFRLHFNMLAR